MTHNSIQSIELDSGAHASIVYAAEKESFNNTYVRRVKQIAIWSRDSEGKAALKTYTVKDIQRLNAVIQSIELERPTDTEIAELIFEKVEPLIS